MTDAGEVSQLSHMDSENKLQRQKEALGDRSRGIAQDTLLLPTVPLVASLLGTFRAQEKESKDTRLRKGLGVLNGGGTLGPLS